MTTKEKLKIAWGQAPALKKYGAVEGFPIKIKYKNLAGNGYKSKAFLSIKPHLQLSTDAVDSDGARQCAQHLSKIAAAVSKHPNFGSSNDIFSNYNDPR